jgi:hypothetical protein
MATSRRRFLQGVGAAGGPLSRRGSGEIRRDRLASGREAVLVFPGAWGRMMDRRRYRPSARECVFASDEIGWDCFGDEDDDDEDAELWSRRRWLTMNLLPCALSLPKMA